jgi:hypothetical protein
VLTVAGCGEKGFSDGPARLSKFCYPHDVEVHYLRYYLCKILSTFSTRYCVDPPLNSAARMPWRYTT